MKERLYNGRFSVVNCKLSHSYLWKLHLLNPASYVGGIVASKDLGMRTECKFISVPVHYLITDSSKESRGNQAQRWGGI